MSDEMNQDGGDDEQMSTAEPMAAPAEAPVESDDSDMESEDEETVA